MADRKISQLSLSTAGDLGNANTVLHLVNPDQASDADKNQRYTFHGLMRAMPDGAVGTPGLAFLADTNTGLYRITGDSIGVATGGTLRLAIDGTSVRPVGIPLQVEDGSVGTPTVGFMNDTDNGLYRSTTNTWHLVAAGAVVATISANGLVSPVVINARTTTPYTFVLSDAGKLITCNYSSTLTLNLPTNASVAFPTGTTIAISHIGTGTVVVDPAVGVTLNGGTANITLAARYCSATLTKIGTDTWIITGALA